MTRIRRGGYVFETWIGDHWPRHVHIYDGRKRVLRWDLEADEPMEGTATARLRDLIRELKREGRL